MCSSHPLMGLRAYEVSRIRALAEESVQLQKKTFQRWIQAKLRDVRLYSCVPINTPTETSGFDSLKNPSTENVSVPEDYMTELKDGRLLMQLCVLLCGASFIVPKETSNRFQQVENINRVLSFLKKQLEADLSDIGAEDIVEGKVQPTLRVVWFVILAHYVYFENEKLKTKRVGTEKEIKVALLEWCREKCRKYDVDVPSFGSSWKSGLAFMALVMDYLKDDERQLIAQSIDLDPIGVLHTAFEMAEKKVQTPKLLDAEEFALLRHDEKSLMTYLMTFKQSIEAQTQDHQDGERDHTQL